VLDFKKHMKVKRKEAETAFEGSARNLKTNVTEFVSYLLPVAPCEA
jgi:hypothetical protein